MKGAQIVLECLKKEGVDYVFGCDGWVAAGCVGAERVCGEHDCGVVVGSWVAVGGEAALAEVCVVAECGGLQFDDCGAEGRGQF